MNNLKSVIAATAATAVLATGVVTTMAPPAAGAPTDQHSAGAASHVALVFVKNAKDPSNSTLQLWNGRSHIATYRAGSGLGTAADYDKEKGDYTQMGKSYRDDCTSDAGWLPNGRYKPTSFETGRNGKIKGYAIGLPDTKCRTGKVKRTALFIHSEMTKGRKQGPRNGADSPQRWEGVHDYKSNGCIKLHPTHIAKLFSYMNKHGRAVLLTVR
ncbi:L,D-transpeptidase family protein [Streptomyces griseus]|uniref:L,D-transpeptidase family protein n=1 Tax=Streptomyces griseus TaxID=1911 RepID=UPI0008406DD5|nr:L,D-transpeptidase family protein [Streptomyces griseus]